MTLLEEIQAACTAEEIASGEHGLIAGKVSAGRTRVQQPTFVGDGLIADAIGLPAGPVFLYQLQLLAEAPLAEEATLEQMAVHAQLVLAWRLIREGKLDVGLPSVRASLGEFVGQLPGFTQQMADAILGLAERDAPVSVAEVIEAMRGLAQQGN